MRSLVEIKNKEIHNFIELLFSSLFSVFGNNFRKLKMNFKSVKILKPKTHNFKENRNILFRNHLLIYIFKEKLDFMSNRQNIFENSFGSYK